MKRCFDLLFSTSGLFLLSPIFLIIASVIKLLMPGPVIFTQKRIGKNSKEFMLFKFRTMVVKSGTQRGSFDAGDASRITPIGRLLRKTKLDELPQLFNVLKGDMSFVGPRPEIEKWTKYYPEKWQLVHTVKPGITDNASLLFRNEEIILAQSENPEKIYRDEILPQKLDLYISYVNEQSLLIDIKIILKTLYEVITK
jgi:lipopolysaccharide/colanic/teichoic acid biosynthesis glycosyltransferase